MRISDWSSDVCSSDLGCREEPTDAHQPHISPLDERTLTRSEAQIQGVAKRAWTGAEQTAATVEEDPTEHTYSMPEMYQHLDEIGVEQGRQREELQGLRGDF